MPRNLNKPSVISGNIHQHQIELPPGVRYVIDCSSINRRTIKVLRLAFKMWYPNELYIIPQILTEQQCQNLIQRCRSSSSSPQQQQQSSLRGPQLLTVVPSAAQSPLSVPRTGKVLYSIVTGIPIVSLDWLTPLLSKSQQLVSGGKDIESSMITSGSISLKNISRPTSFNPDSYIHYRITTGSCQQPFFIDTKLFKGQQICFQCGKYGTVDISKRRIHELVRKLGGTVVSKHSSANRLIIHRWTDVNSGGGGSGGSGNSDQRLLIENFQPCCSTSLITDLFAEIESSILQSRNDTTTIPISIPTTIPISIPNDDMLLIKSDSTISSSEENEEISALTPLYNDEQYEEIQRIINEYKNNHYEKGHEYQSTQM